METMVILKGAGLISATLVGSVILVLTYGVAEKGSLEDACIWIATWIQGFLRR